MIRLVVALPAEARPLVRELRLERQAGSAPPGLFRRDDLALAVSGVGRRAAAAAVARLGAVLEPGRHWAWLNVGVGGHPQAPVGSLFLAHRVTEEASGRAWEPPPLFEPPCESAWVRTVDEVEQAFREQAVYEMEASGFLAAALRLAPAELVQVMKVVSDNRRTGALQVTAGAVEQLIERSLPRILTVLERLGTLAVEARAG